VAFGHDSFLKFLSYTPNETGDYLRTPIYDETMDSSKQIADALILAKEENNQVLLQFGANWCHVLHHLFDTDKAVHEKIQSDYVVVLVDVNKVTTNQPLKNTASPHSLA
jgi:Protein of unknown function, DUF255